jgi:ATP-dependent exoDNAse (exonuclease V) beta subunit
MAMLAQTLAKTKSQRHQCVEDFFLINDSTTVATEVPVYLLPEEAPDLQLKEPLTGHIDILQRRNDKIYILDYKPDQDPAQAAQQLYLYKLALSKRTGIPMSEIATASFNESSYVEFG